MPVSDVGSIAKQGPRLMQVSYVWQKAECDSIVPMVSMTLQFVDGPNESEMQTG